MTMVSSNESCSETATVVVIYYRDDREKFRSTFETREAAVRDAERWYNRDVSANYSTIHGG